MTPMPAIRWLTLAVLVLAGPAVGDDKGPAVEPVEPVGQPKGYKPGQSSRYAVWYTDAGWHFRLTTSSDRIQTFEGVITVVGGRMTSLTPQGTAGKGSPVGTPVKTTAPSYRFTTKLAARYEAGIDFTLDDRATAVKFDLKINGKPAPAQVFIGAKGEHPKAGTFTLPARPGKKE